MQFFGWDAVGDGLRDAVPVDGLFRVEATDDVLVGHQHADDVEAVESDVCVNPHQMGGRSLEKLRRQMIPRVRHQGVTRSVLVEQADSAAHEDDRCLRQ
jgi:predicted phosphodiesterase